MSFGFRIYNADGTIQIDSDSIGLLFVDEFSVASGTLSKTYTGLAPATLTVVADGDSKMNSGATITQTVVGADKQVSVSVQRSGRFRVMME